MSEKPIPLFVAVLPVLFLIGLLSYNVGWVFGDDALSGSNQIILLLSGLLAGALGVWQGRSVSDILAGIRANLGDTTKALIILLLIGSLSGAWLVSGIIPAFIYYGLGVLSPAIFLPATVIIAALVSLATGSSWSTSATVGIALMGIGEAMGLNTAMVAGAVISGAYFGDKMSPMSDTTNLAAAMAGTDLFTHIRYMMLTSGPSILIALVVFSALSFSGEATFDPSEVERLREALEAKFNLGWWLFLVPAVTIGMIARKVDALVALTAGTLLGSLVAVIAQPDILATIAGDTGGVAGVYKGTMISLYTKVKLSEAPILADLLSSKGMEGMLGTVWLIVSAMVFGGAMEAAGFLRRITEALMGLANSTASLIATTLVTCGVINVTASDQYLALVVPGRMFRPIYAEKGLPPQNLSRSLEDSGTVTSVLVPWNTCAAYQSGVLGVATGDYFIYCIFNLCSPLISLLLAVTGWKIATESPPAESAQ